MLRSLQKINSHEILYKSLFNIPESEFAIVLPNQNDGSNIAALNVKKIDWSADTLKTQYYVFFQVTRYEF